MTYFVTGAAGFIGYFVSLKLLERGEKVIGLDSLNSYYSPELKKLRLQKLFQYADFKFFKAAIEDSSSLNEIFLSHKIDVVIHLAAQAGVRYSIECPEEYGSSNLTGFLNILQICRKHEIAHLLFASSSSVYGMKNETPYRETDCVDYPVSLYAATKKANELMAHSYSHLYGIPCTGLRFFTVYGALGRPDMAYFKFAEKIWKGEPIEVFNNGNLYRDFTYIDDITEGILKLSLCPPVKKTGSTDSSSVQKPLTDAPFEIYNIGNEKPEHLMHFIDVLENSLGKKAVKKFLPMQAGDVYITAADTSKLRSKTGWKPSTSIEDGLKNFAEWFLKYKKGL